MYTDKEFQQSYEQYLEFKVAIVQAIAGCRQAYTQQPMPTETKNLVDKIENFLNTTTRSTLIWTQLSDMLKNYAWHRYYFGPLGVFLKSIDNILKKFTILSLMQKDILELENINKNLEHRCGELEKNNIRLRSELNQMSDSTLAERYHKLEQENQILKSQNKNLIEKNELQLEHLQQLEQYNAQLMLRIEKLAEANELMQKTHIELHTRHKQVMDQLEQDDEFKKRIVADIELIRKLQIEQTNQIKTLRESGAEKDKRIETLTQQITNNTSKKALRYYSVTKQQHNNLNTGNSTYSSNKMPVHQISSNQGCEIHQPLWLNLT